MPGRVVVLIRAAVPTPATAVAAAQAAVRALLLLSVVAMRSSARSFSNSGVLAAKLRAWWQITGNPSDCKASYTCEGNAVACAQVHLAPTVVRRRAGTATAPDRRRYMCTTVRLYWR